MLKQAIKVLLKRLIIIYKAGKDSFVFEYELHVTLFWQWFKPTFPKKQKKQNRHRGYSMPARGYEFYLRVEHKKIKFISVSEYVIFCLLYKHPWNAKSACFQRRDLLCNHNDGALFACEDNMLSSRVKVWSFHGKAHLLFHWCLYNKHLH